MSLLSNRILSERLLNEGRLQQELEAKTEKKEREKECTSWSVDAMKALAVGTAISLTGNKNLGQPGRHIKQRPLLDGLVATPDRVSEAFK